MYLHCGTVYNSKDLEWPQISFNDRPDKENVPHIHHGILHSHKKWLVCFLHRNVDESGNRHSQQTDTRTENQIPHVLTHRWVLNNENTWTQGGEHHTLWSVGGGQGRDSGGWRVKVDNMGRNTRYRWWGGWRQQTTLPVCTYATVLYALLMYPKT